MELDELPELNLKSTQFSIARSRAVSRKSRESTFYKLLLVYHKSRYNVNYSDN